MGMRSQSQALAALSPR